MYNGQDQLGHNACKKDQSTMDQSTMDQSYCQYKGPILWVHNPCIKLTCTKDKTNGDRMLVKRTNRNTKQGPIRRVHDTCGKDQSYCRHNAFTKDKTNGDALLVKRTNQIGTQCIYKGPILLGTLILWVHNA